LPALLQPLPKLMSLTRLRNLAPLALLPALSFAQTTVYSTNFSTGAANPAQASYVAGDWAVLSSRAGSQGVTSYAANAFRFGMTGGSSAVVEAQTRFSDTKVQLSVGEVVRATWVFTATNNIMVNAQNNSTLNVGLYDATTLAAPTGTNPVTSLANGGLVATGGATGFETGFAADWRGYMGRFGHAGVSTTNHEIRTRPAQAEVAGATESQDLVFADGVTGGYDTPNGVLLSASGLVPPPEFDLVNASQYTITFTITQSTATSQLIELGIYNGSTSAGPAIQFVTGTASDANVIASGFNGAAIGYRFSGTSAASSLTLNSFAVEYTAIPEPSTYAAVLGALGLALAGVIRRRRS
jgi:MYXO-CTERM domain-containing protein